MRRTFRATDIAQLYLVGTALVFLAFVFVTGVFAQSQDAINATLFERINGIVFRLDRLENYTTAAILALIANFFAHLIQIREQRQLRQRPPLFKPGQDG